MPDAKGNGREEQELDEHGTGLITWGRPVEAGRVAEAPAIPGSATWIRGTFPGKIGTGRGKNVGLASWSIAGCPS